MRRVRLGLARKGDMATTAEIREQLTGPGEPFEVVTETVNGVEMRVYKSSMGSLREVAQAAHNRGNDPDQPFLVYGDLRLGFQDFVEQANALSQALQRDHGV